MHVSRCAPELSNRSISSSRSMSTSPGRSVFVALIILVLLATAKCKVSFCLHPRHSNRHHTIIRVWELLWTQGYLNWEVLSARCSHVTSSRLGVDLPFGCSWGSAWGARKPAFWLWASLLVNNGAATWQPNWGSKQQRQESRQSDVTWHQKVLFWRRKKTVVDNF
jgi:hypothetical protein